MQGKTFSMQLAGRTLTVETGKYAEQAGGLSVGYAGQPTAGGFRSAEG